MLTRRVSNSTANKHLASSCYFTPDDISVSDYSSSPLVFTTETPDCLEKFARPSLPDPKPSGRFKLTIFSENKEVNKHEVFLSIPSLSKPAKRRSPPRERPKSARSRDGHSRKSKDRKDRERSQKTV